MSFYDLNKIWFASFADKRLNIQLNRISHQAEEFGFSGERIMLFNEDSLDSDFKEKMAPHLITGNRGFGYWCWKPQVVLQAFGRMDYGEILLYLDAGCYLNNTPAATRRFYDYLRMVDQYDLCGFQGKSFMATHNADPLHHYRLERCWTKGDLFDYFQCRNNPQITETGQMSGGIFLVKKTHENIDFFKQYREVFFKNLHLADNTPSISPNLPGFIENRHDQSIFSILCKLRWDGRNTYSTMEYAPYLDLAPSEFKHEPRYGTTNWREMRFYPIHARRDKRKGGWKALLPIGIFSSLQRVWGKILNLKLFKKLGKQ